MYLFAGLGNIGTQYVGTRHNIGFDFVDFVASKFDIQYESKFDGAFGKMKNSLGENIFFIKPGLYMNKSGISVKKVFDYFKIEEYKVFVAFDDLDLKTGEAKIAKSKYPKSHNGVNNIVEQLGHAYFYSIRIGIDSRNEVERNNIGGSDYVLSKYTENYFLTFENLFLKINNKFNIFV